MALRWAPVTWPTWVGRPSTWDGAARRARRRGAARTPHPRYHHQILSTTFATPTTDFDIDNDIALPIVEIRDSNSGMSRRLQNSSNSIFLRVEWKYNMNIFGWLDSKLKWFNFKSRTKFDFDAWVQWMWKLCLSGNRSGRIFSRRRVNQHRYKVTLEEQHRRSKLNRVHRLHLTNIIHCAILLASEEGCLGCLFQRHQRTILFRSVR